MPLVKAEPVGRVAGFGTDGAGEAFIGLGLIQAVVFLAVEIGAFDMQRVEIGGILAEIFGNGMFGPMLDQGEFELDMVCGFMGERFERFPRIGAVGGVELDKELRGADIGVFDLGTVMPAALI